MLRNTLKKGEITFTQIIVAVLALFVLIILIMIFSSNINIINDDMRSCKSQGGVCEDECVENTIPRYGNYSDCRSPRECCIKFLS